MTNEEFAEKVGIDYTTASRLRNGRRLPSGQLLVRIHDEFRIPWQRLMEAYAKGPAVFSELLGRVVFKRAG